MNKYEKALKKIKHDEKCKPKCCMIIGPTGPSGQLSNVYGGLNNSTSQFVVFTAVNNYVQIRLNTPLPSNRVQINDNNTLTILEGGTYEINFNMLISTSAAVDVGFAVRNNGAVLTQTQGAQTLSLDSTTGLTYDGRLSGSTFAILNSGDVLDLAVRILNTLPTGLDAVINGNANCTLTVKKIDD